MMEIVINQNENQNITIENENIQNINISQEENQNIEIQNKPPQELDIEQGRNQTILIDGGGVAYGITDVLVNGVSVVSDNIAYILVPTKTSELQNNSGFITNETDPTVPSYVKAISLADINNWNNKQDELVSGSTIKTINNESLLGSGNLSIEGTVYSAGTGININASNEISNTIVSYNDLEDLPTIPTKTSDLLNDSDYVTENELSDVAFSGSYADLSNIPVIPDSTSELTNDSGFIDKNVNDLTYYTPTANLGAVALSNDYTDLTNKPTIPTVNDGVLTIQKNGTNIDTFSANSSNNKTVNITVPTNTSDLNNDSGFINAIKTINNNSLIGSGNLTISNIVETGSNTNGSYIKFDNDYMICFNQVIFYGMNITNGYEGVYYENTGNITYPQQFTNTPNVIIGALNIAGGGFSFYQITDSVFYGFIWKVQGATKDVYLNYIAIGKWR